jgi:dihydrofolate reductase
MITSLDGCRGGGGRPRHRADDLVDKYHLFITTSVVGGGKRFFPDGVRLDLELVEERAFDNGLVYVCYRTR